MKDWIEEVLFWLFIIALAATSVWFIYKVAAGVYHLLDKLIDKI